jgi:hypothetical protein
MEGCGAAKMKFLSNINHQSIPLTQTERQKMKNKIPKIGKRGWIGVALVIIGAVVIIQGLNNHKDDFDVAMTNMAKHGGDAAIASQSFDGGTSRSTDLCAGSTFLIIGAGLILFGYMVKTKGMIPPWEKAEKPATPAGTPIPPAEPPVA